MGNDESTVRPSWRGRVRETEYHIYEYGLSGPIFTFLIQFEFYPTKQSRFKKISLPMFLEFHLVFTYFF
jgi:hypothetical protein